MKKHKFTLWLNIATLCLCFAILAFGVYSAKRARLTTSGTVGFKAHECEVAVVATIENAMRSESLDYAIVSDKIYTNQGESSDQTWQDKFDKGPDSNGKLVTLSKDNNDVWSFGDIFFDDMNISNDEDMQPIIITFSITNYSLFPVKASFTLPTITNISTEGSVNEIVVNAFENETPGTSQLVLQMAISDTTQEVSFEGLNLDVNLERNIFEASTTSYNGYVDGGEYVITQVPSGSGTLVIPNILKQDGKTYRVKKITGSSNGKCITNADKYSEIIVQEGIEQVEIASFTGCTLKKITLPSTITDIGYAAFFNVISLEEVVLPSNLKSIGEWAFSGTALNSITIPNSVKTIEKRAFSGCSNLQSVTLSKNLKSINERAFNNCTSLTTITLPEGLEKIEKYAFFQCTSLNNIKIPTSCKIILQEAFSKCTALANVEIPSTMQNFGFLAFYNTPFLNNNVDTPKQCYDDSTKYYLTKISSTVTDTTTITNYDKVNILIDGATYATRSDNSYTFGTNSIFTNLSMPNVEVVGDYAFNTCTALTSFDLPALKFMGCGAFSGCTSLNIVLPTNLVFIGNQAFSKSDGGTATTITIPASTIQIGGDYYVGDNEENEILGTHVFYMALLGTLNNFVVEEGNQHFKAHEGVLYTKNYKYLIAYPPVKEETDYTMPEGCEDCFQMAFSRTTTLINLTLANSFNIIDGRNRVLNHSTFSGNSCNLDAAIYNYSRIENIYVKEDNTKYTSISGVLYSKDGKELLCKPLYNCRCGTFTVADSCERIDIVSMDFTSGAMQHNGVWVGGQVSKIVLGANVKYISPEMLDVLNTTGTENPIERVSNSSVYIVNEKGLFQKA